LAAAALTWALRLRVSAVLLAPSAAVADCCLVTTSAVARSHAVGVTEKVLVVAASGVVSSAVPWM